MACCPLLLDELVKLVSWAEELAVFEVFTVQKTDKNGGDGEMKKKKKPITITRGDIKSETQFLLFSLPNVRLEKETERKGREQTSQT